MGKLADYIARMSASQIIWMSNPQAHSSGSYHRSQNEDAHTDHIHVSFKREYDWQDPGREIVSSIELIDLHGKRSIISKHVDGTVSQTYVQPGSGMEKLRDRFLRRMREDHDEAKFKELREGTWAREEEDTKALHKVWQDMLLYGHALIEDRIFDQPIQPTSDFDLETPLQKAQAFDRATKRINDLISKPMPDLPRESLDETIDLFPQAPPTFSVARALRDSAANQPKPPVVRPTHTGDPHGAGRLQRAIAGDKRNGPGKKGRKARRV